jgi:FMN-dependent NADH-azoreductase
MRLLNIQASPRGAQSVSIALPMAFLEAFQAINPAVEIDTLNVWDGNLPEFDPARRSGPNTRASRRS